MGHQFQTEMFDIKVPYTTSPQMTRATGPLFTLSNTYTFRKSVELELWKTDLYGTIDDNAKDLVRKACSLCNVEETDNIVKFAMNFEEDVAILHKGVLSAICFCFPSSWVPRERIGMSLSKIHSEVADGQRLVDYSQKIAEVMCKQSFERFVWTICNSNSLSQHPKSKSNHVPQTIDDLYFRTEKQTTMPLDEESSLFFVHVSVYPLNAVFQDKETKQKIIDSVNSMSDNVLKYKNLVKIKEVLTKIL